MRILVIGDFHGKFPNKLQKEANKVDLVVSVGDYFPYSLRKESFKYAYKQKEKELWEFIGKKKVKEKTLKDLNQGEKIIKDLNKLKIPVIIVTGNSDYTKWPEIYDAKKLKWKFPEQDFFTGIIKKYKNVRCFDYSFVRFKGFVFIGIANSSFPGKVKSRTYKKYRKILERLFKKFKKENKNRKIIFVSHNVPFNTKLDIIRKKDAHKLAKGRHYGSKLARRITDKYQPFLFLGGHMHENQGKDKIKKTIIVNPGPASEGKAAIIEIDDKKGRVKNIKFLK